MNRTMRPRQRTNRIAAAAAVLALALSACGGPNIALEVGSKEIPVDIVFGGKRAAPPPPPAGADPGPIGFPGFIQPPPPRLEPGVPPVPGPPPPSCPIANPLDASLLVARLTAQPPVPATYVYKNEGKLKAGDASTEYPAVTTHVVQNVQSQPAEEFFDYDVVATVAGVATTTTYRVRTGGQAPDRGIYIVQTVRRSPTRTQAFTPSAPILLLPFPSPEYGTNLEDEIDGYRGQRYRSAGTDPLTQTTMVLEATFIGKTRVDACGEWIDAFEVEVTLGSIVGPGQQLDFTGRFAVAPQYGALIVEDTLHMTGTEDFGTEDQQTIEINNRSRITKIPANPADQRTT